jgi:hypothetical protein
LTGGCGWPATGGQRDFDRGRRPWVGCRRKIGCLKPTFSPYRPVAASINTASISTAMITRLRFIHPQCDRRNFGNAAGGGDVQRDDLRIASADCQRQIGLAIHNYESTYRVLPISWNGLCGTSQNTTYRLELLGSGVALC